ncbi:unnamed protein product [Pseudo-nitzschia multistriata]|uniref:Uncharacterized protein n=1 Tax=Pseudo-nitzschia multistriata TaxID=183589 RepID=A0A448Z1N4_9STRA|nr:unnamed protein product [Pseudo-nitzschia multistriata]
MRRTSTKDKQSRRCRRIRPRTSLSTSTKGFSLLHSALPLFLGLVTLSFTSTSGFGPSVIPSALSPSPALFLRSIESSPKAIANGASSRSSSSLSAAASEGEQTTRAKATPFSPEELVAMARDYVENPSPDWWSDEEFVFRGPVIGPLVKKDLVATLTANEDLRTAFPDLQQNAFGFTADDPIEPNRVWYFVRPRGTFAGPFPMPGTGKMIQPTNAPYIGPPECRSVIFNREGKIKYQSVGYVVDRFTGDTTGGRGAIFGQYAVMGQDIDANPGAVSTIFLQKLSEYLPQFPKSYSKREDLPKWWTDERMGAEL